MQIRPPHARTAATWLAAGLGAGAGVYGACAGLAWWRYGAPPAPLLSDADPLLERWLPVYDVVERHHVRVAAPPAITLAAAREMNLFAMPGIRQIFDVRACAMGVVPDRADRPGGLLAQVTAIGWRVLAEVPDREVLVGAVTRPWEPNPVFTGMDAAAFAACATPESVKIAWTLRADPDGEGGSIFRTETRAVATDDAARARFRRYWALVSPGVFLIRRLSLAPLKADAERRAAAAVA